MESNGQARQFENKRTADGRQKTPCHYKTIKQKHNKVKKEERDDGEQRAGRSRRAKREKPTAKGTK